jgi:hypothetical protein
MVSRNPNNYRPLGGSARRYLDLTTGETLSRRHFDQLFRLPIQGYRSFEEKAAARGAPRAATGDRFYGVVRRIGAGERSLSRAARAEHISLATVHRLNRGRGTFTPQYAPGKTTGRNVLVGYAIHKAAGRVNFWTDDRAFHPDIPFDRQMLSVMSRYDIAVHVAMDKNDERLLVPYVGMVVYDVYGTPYHLLTDLNALYQVHYRDEDPDIAPLFTSEEVVLRAR